jgi:isopentenyldiphosphate isomerase
MKRQPILVTLDAEGAITLPEIVVDALNVKEGDLCSWQMTESSLSLERLKTELADEADEWLDLVDREDQVIGRVSRAEAWEKRLPVRGINAFLLNSRGELWIPRRTLHKWMFPGCLDMSVGGHVDSGEEYLTAFKRETREELNLDVDATSWRELGYFTPADGLNIFMRVYEIRSDTAPDFNPDDFTEAFWLTPGELLARIDAGEAAKGDLRELVRLCYGGT